MKEKLNNDLKIAMKEKNVIATKAIRQIKASITEEECRGVAHEADNNTIIKLIQKLIKQHEDSILQYKQANRLELVDTETKELEVLQTYVPKGLSENELKREIDLLIEAVPIKNMSVMGLIMKELNSKFAGRFDGKTASQYIKEKLS